MTPKARDLLATFESLDAAERQQVAVEILRRSGSFDDVPDAAFDELAADVFQVYDAKEAAGGRQS